MTYNMLTPSDSPLGSGYYGVHHPVTAPMPTPTPSTPHIPPPPPLLTTDLQPRPLINPLQNTEASILSNSNVDSNVLENFLDW